ncbi:MAG: hypothetical protein ACM3P1_00040 [Candidatus Saccharibacteria bacterium]
MKRYILLLALSVMVIITIVAQNPKSDKTQKPKNSPKEDIKVNREYDEKGNLIKFDSTYSYSFSSDTTLKDFNFKDFPDPFGMNFNFFNDSDFNKSFFKDFDPSMFQSLRQNQDSLIKKFHKGHNLHLKNDSTMQSFNGLDEFFNQFQGLPNDSNAAMQPFFQEFNFNAGEMKKMMDMMAKQMQEMQSQHQKLQKQ